MKSREYYHRQLQSANELQLVVKAMKASAGSAVQQFRQAAESLDKYEETVHLGLKAWFSGLYSKEHPGKRQNRIMTGAKQASGKFKTGILVFGSEQGMCGQFNQVIANFTVKKLEELSLTPVSVKTIGIGHRIQVPLENERFQSEEYLPLPSTISALSGDVQQAVIQLESWQKQDINQVLLFYNHLKTKSSYKSLMIQLLPLDTGWLKEIQSEPWLTHQIPLYTMKPADLFAKLIEEYLFTSLYRAYAHTLASENASRLVTMQNAEKNIDDHIQKLQLSFNHFRQNQIDEELRDIISGFEAIVGNQ